MNLSRIPTSESRNPYKSAFDPRFTHRCEQRPVHTNSIGRVGIMEAIGLLVTLEARAGKEADAEAFLKSAQPLALE